MWSYVKSCRGTLVKHQENMRLDNEMEDGSSKQSDPEKQNLKNVLYHASHIYFQIVKAL